MDLFARLLIRMALWARRPPSKRWLIAAGGAIAVSVLILGIEALGWWPESWQMDRLPRVPGAMLR